MTDISIVIVSYNSAKELKPCVEAVLASDVAEVIIIDNASDDISELNLEEMSPKIKLFLNTTNEGYARAINKGIEKSTGKFVLLLNPDVVVNAPGISAMSEALDKDESTYAAAARLDWPDGRFQRYFTADPTAAALVARLTILEPILRNSASVKKYLKADMSPEITQELETAPGACLMIKKSAIDKIGGMDERFPLFFNDVDYCVRLRHSGGKIMYLPDARFTHIMQASVGRMKPELRRGELMLSAVRYIGKYKNSASAFALKLLFVIDLKIRAAATMFRLLTGKKNASDFSAAVKAVCMVVFNKSLFN